MNSRTAAVAVVGALATAAACTGDDSSTVGNRDPDAIPSPVGTAFTGGAFDDVPVFRGATPVQEPTETNGAVTASYETDTARPETVLRFYDENLPPLGWRVVDPVVESSESVWRGGWVRDGRRLQVSALALAADSATDATDTQFSLILLPDTADVPVATAAP